MPMGRRKAPFSKKKRKEYIKNRNERKKLMASPPDEDNDKREVCQMPDSKVENLQNADNPGKGPAMDLLEEIEAINQQPRGRGNTNRYNLKFKKETKEERKSRKAAHYTEIEPLPETALEATTELFFPVGLRYPDRPPWNMHMSKQKLDISENRHFRLFCENLERDFNNRELSPYELNLETWRQLWRVTEMSDIILIIVDARYSVAQFPPYLYEHLVKRERDIILVMNKCDLVPGSVVKAWQHYFQTHYPRLLLIPFSSLVGHCTMRLVEACKNIVGEAVNLQSWGNKVEMDTCSSELSEVAMGPPEVEEDMMEDDTVNNTQPEYYQRFRDDILTIGTIGYPNVGKSSLINALKGKKVVSVSKTPGHTKHFQTIFLTKTVKLCDCPGLVFPSCLTRPLQVISGSYPIAQVRDTIGVVRYIASRLDLPRILKLKITDYEDITEKWTPYYICEAWAKKRGYHTRKGGYPDVNRAANELLRLCCAGQKSLVLYFRPPGYITNRDKYETDSMTEAVKGIPGFLAVLDNVEEEDTDKGETSEETSIDGSEDEESEEEMVPSNRFALLSNDD
ncbi:hypothetical protein Pmani_011670 [Petrolisthes manimaculis]|uniref:Guanine nucleotide-binding protein-like 1 n=1 Tax=Petrolisthes manimaculis TaxID=1843537 RepID=A0AAE1UE86_9EUCA|nr:hypothetical protein Pmani_011670 [Petrolisthes manimaculis]